MTSKKEFGSLSRELTTEEQHFLSSLGQKFSRHEPLTPLLRRAYLAMLGESRSAGLGASPRLTAQEREILKHYIRYPRELRVLAPFPPRTQPYQLVAALTDHYLTRNGGRLRIATRYSGPRRRAYSLSAL